MSKTNSELVTAAQASLKGKWGVTIGAVLINSIIAGACSKVPYTVGLAPLVINGPLELGMAILALSVCRNDDSKIELLFKGFNHFVTAFVAYLLRLIYVVLWSFLLIVPGIIKALSYSMTMYIIADDSTISAQTAITKSKKMMEGNKGRYFLLMLRFISLPIIAFFVFISMAFSAFYTILLSAISGSLDYSNLFSLFAGVGSFFILIPILLIVVLIYIFWLVPLMKICSATFYQDLKAKEIEIGIN